MTNPKDDDIKAVAIMAIVALACYVMVDKETAKSLWDNVKDRIQKWVG